MPCISMCSELLTVEAAHRNYLELEDTSMRMEQHLLGPTRLPQKIWLVTIERW